MMGLRSWMFKKLSEMVHTGRPFYGSGLPQNTHFGYATKVGDGSNSSVVMPPINWICRTFPEAKLAILKLNADGSKDPVENHPMIELLQKPNPFYSGLDLFSGVLISYHLDGNAYLIAIRNKRTRAINELWYAPHWSMDPKYPQSGSQFISHYKYSPGGGHIPVDLDIDDVIHFRQGINPKNVRKGLSPLAAQMREIYTDDEASNFTASMLRNMGVPGVIISPATGDQGVSGDDAKATKAYIDSRFTGDNRGKPIALTGPTKVEQFGFNMRELQMGDIRDISEERVCAALGIPAAVVGFGTGLQTTKVGATMREMKRLAWEGNLIPTQRAFSEQLKNKLLPEFEPDPENFIVKFDRSDVEALQESMNERATRVNTMVGGGWLRVDRAQEMMGLQPDESQPIYLRSMATIEVAAGEKARKSGLKREDNVTLDLYENNPPQRRTPTAAQRRLLRRMDRERESMTDIFRKELEKFFNELGKEAGRAGGKILKERTDLQTKDAEILDIEAEALLAEMNILEYQNGLNKKGSSHFLMVAKQTFESVEASLGLSIGLSDPVQAKIIAEGGRRLGLVDLSKQTRARLFRELSLGRELQESVPQLVRRIRNGVSAGPWSSPQVRAEIIARTETRHAQRTSSLMAYQESGVVQRVLVLDNRVGFHDPGQPGENIDDGCVFWDGREIPIEDAGEVMSADHPNGTRDLVPVIT